jgi:membrane-associated protease RseP (regulator of RpoE activity)
MAFFLGPDSTVYGRYGGRDATSAEGRVSLPGLRHAMESALAAHRRGDKPPDRPRTPEARTVDDYPAAKRLPERACVHCHQVYDFRREALQAADKWILDEVWVNPLPENVGQTLEVDRGNVVGRVGPDSAAARLGLRPGDRLLRVNKHPVASQADVQYALHRTPDRGALEIDWQRDGEAHSGTTKLPEGWRKTDVSWRWSLRGLDPAPWVQGEDLTADEKKALGLKETALAFRQGNFVSTPARQAGIRQNDVILGVDGKSLEMTARQFAAYIRLEYKVGDRVTYNVLRGDQRLDVRLELPGRRP